MNTKKIVNFHVDIDSPKKLAEFWGLNDISITNEQIENFYKVSLTRALELFDKHNIKVTFFCVGEEIESCETARTMLKKAYEEGHELANHTYSHAYGLTRMDRSQIQYEIERCSDIIASLTNKRPVGFRSPGFDINGKILRILDELGYKYDSSAFWSSLNILLKPIYRMFSSGKNVHDGFGESSFRLPAEPYFPSNENWQKRADTGTIIELPIARSQVLSLPFYSNFHLMTPRFYRNRSILKHSGENIVYLMHLIEFADINDDIPQELQIHPNMKVDVSKKLDILEDIIVKICTHFTPMRTDTCIENGFYNINLD